MNKQEACAFLGISERSLARHAAAGKVQVTYTKGTRGNVAVYDDADLERLKEELGQPVSIRPANEQALSQKPAISDKLAMRPAAGLAEFFEALQARDESFITSLLSSRAQIAIENKL